MILIWEILTGNVLKKLLRHHDAISSVEKIENFDTDEDVIEVDEGTETVDGSETTNEAPEKDDQEPEIDSE